MTDTDRIEAMRAANWTPAVEYWRNAAQAAEMEVHRLRAQLAYANEAHAAETARADRSEQSDGATQELGGGIRAVSFLIGSCIGWAIWGATTGDWGGEILIGALGACGFMYISGALK